MAATGSRLSKDLRGFGIPDSRFTFANVSSTYSSYTEAGPRPGSPLPSDANSKLRLGVSGEQSDNLTATVTRAGVPATDQTGVRLAVRKTSATAAAGNTGWNTPNLINGWVAAEYSSAATCGPPDAAVIPSTSGVVAVYQRGNIINSNLWDADAWTWGGRQTVIDLGGSGGIAAIVCLPGGTERLLCISVGTDYTQGVVHYSDDGTTWGLWNQNVLPSAPTTTTRLRARAFYSNGDVGFWLVVDNAGTTTVYHYGSTNLGTSFSLVNTWSVGSSAAAPEFFRLADGRMGAVYIKTADSRLYFRRVATVWDSFTTDTTTIHASNTYAACSAYVDHDGTIYVYGRASGTADHWDVYRSVDGGDSFSQLKWGLYDGNDTSTYPTKLKVVACAGYAAIIHQWVASPGDEDNSIAMMVAGGWSSFEAAPILIASTTEEDLRRMGTGPTGVATCNSVTWLPYDAPQDTAGWTTAGAGTDALSTSGTATVTTAANTRYFTATSSSGSARVVVAAVDLTVTSGGTLGTSRVSLSASVSTGAADREVYINFATTGFRIIDNSSGAVLATITIDLTTPLQVLVALANNSANTGGHADVMYRRRGETVWTIAYSGAAGSGVIGYAAGAMVVWGHIASGTAVSDWSLVSAMFGGTAAATEPYWSHPGSVDTWHDDLTGKALNAYPYPLGLQATAGTTYVRALSGPGRVAETHSIPVACDYGIERIFWENSPSPDEVWRSTSTAEQIIGFDLTTTTPIGKAIAIYLGNANFRTAYWEGWDGAAWQTDGTYDGSTGFVTSLTASVSGNTISPNTSTTAAAGRYVQRGEFIGRTVVCNGTYYEIAAHSEGVIAPASSSGAKQATFRVSGSPSAGALQLIAGHGVLVIHNTTARSRYRLRIPTQSCKDSYFELGTLLVCQVQPVGQEWDWGATRERQTNYEETVSRRGTARRKKLGPPPETWTVSWSGTDLTALRTTADLDWLSGKAGYAPLVNQNDVPWLLNGLLDELDSGATPLLLLNSIPDASSADTTTVTDQTRFCYGYLTGSISQDLVVGDEGENELVRVDAISIERII